MLRLTAPTLRAAPRPVRSAAVPPDVAPELPEQRLVEREGDPHLVDDPTGVRGREAERVEPGAVGVLVELGLRDGGEVVERDAAPAEAEGAVQDAPDRLSAGEVAEVA